jgi:signal transduction histidine kinase
LTRESTGRLGAVAATLIEIANTLDSAVDERLRLGRALELLRGLLACDRCALLLDGEQDGRRELLAVPAPEPDQAALHDRLAQLWRSIEHNDPVPGGGAASDLALPLVGLDRVRGILLIERRGAPFDTDEIRLVSIVAAQLGAYLTTLFLHRRAVALDEFKQEMAMLVAHDIKNPVAAVISTVDYLAAGPGEGPQELAGALAEIRAACERILRLAANLLDLSRLEANRLPLRRVTLDLGTVLPAIARQRMAQAAAKKVTLAVVDAPNPLRVQADEDLLSRIVENVLDNALRYTPRGGLIELRAEQAGAKVQVRVGNNGAAVPPEAWTTIFEKFGRASTGGSRMNLGLGLYFARVALEAQGGGIRVERTDALPTVFVIELPVAPGA